MTEPTQTTKYVVEFTVPPDDRDGTTGIKFEDGGAAAIMYAPLNTNEDGLNPDTWEKAVTGGDGHFFVRLQSWDKTHLHPLFRSLMGKRVRVIIEDVTEKGSTND